jgi:hypothetical protein
MANSKEQKTRSIRAWRTRRNRRKQGSGDKKNQKDQAKRTRRNRRRDGPGHGEHFRAKDKNNRGMEYSKEQKPLRTQGMES